MRDFSQTHEPMGGSPGARTGHSFVVQQHAARRMHYDFRLELDGVLRSWSIPKGPSLSPTERRLAVRTEDHPLDYAGFEGVIPQGQYGGGTVVVWDRGSWEPEGDAHAGLARGRLTFTLHGKKLRGRWHLIKIKREAKAENWLLFKARDDAANDELDIVAAQPASVLSGRTVDQITAAPERVWHSQRDRDPPVADQRAAKLATAGGSGPGAADKQRELVALVERLPVGFKLTNLDKVLFPSHGTRHAPGPDPGITKAALIAYLAVVADRALPHIAHRPLTLLRCPDGVDAQAGGRVKCFFQKHLTAGSPPAIEAVPIVEHAGAGDGKPVDYMQIHDLAGLVALAQLGTLEIHTWGAHTDQLERPDLLVFDLDPDAGLGWEKVALGAFELRRRLRHAGLESFVKTTGSKGLHVVVPIARGVGWGDAKAFSKAVVEAMERDEPASYTTNMAKPRRQGKVFLDYLRNGRGATFIAPYSPRARAGAPIAVPIAWEELAHGLDPATLTLASVPARLAARSDDPWKAITAVEQAITAATWRAIGGKR